jgi:hypothetical protein
MKTIEVADKWSIDQFLQLPYAIYKDDPNWVCPLFNDIELVVLLHSSITKKHTTRQSQPEDVAFMNVLMI